MQDRLPPLPPNVVAALDRGKAIEAVKLLRQSSGLGLGDAMKAIAQHVGRTSASQQQRPAKKAASAASPQQVAAAADKVKQALSRQRGLAPGEVPRTNGGVWLALVLIAVVGYYVFR